MHNIEKSGFRRGEYVGYGSGTVWRIVKNGKLWNATARDSLPNNLPNFYGRTTLKEISDVIENANAGVKRNPTKKPLTRKSQITGRAPTPRLKKRRVKNT